MIRLYIIPGSNPSLAAELMLKRKGIDHRRRDLIPTVHIAIVRALGFPSIPVDVVPVSVTEDDDLDVAGEQCPRVSSVSASMGSSAIAPGAPPELIAEPLARG